jgi:hypothetical protein
MGGQLEKHRPRGRGLCAAAVTRAHGRAVPPPRRLTRRDSSPAQRGWRVSRLARLAVRPGLTTTSHGGMPGCACE